MTAAQRLRRDAEARRLIAEELDRTFVVEAAAGTGKTTELVRRVLGVLRTGRATLDRVVAVTFTEKAAGEMKLRVRAALEAARTDDSVPAEERARLDAALAGLEAARIGTIHALCSDLLRERPVEARVDPAFEVVDDEEARLLTHAFDSWFERVLSDPPEGVRRILRRRPWRSTGDGPRELLINAVDRLRQHRDHRGPWTAPALDRDGFIDRVVDEIAAVGAFADLASQPDDYLGKCCAELRLFADELRAREEARDRDYDGLEAALRDLRGEWWWRWVGRGRWYGEGIPRAELRARRDALAADLDALLAQADAHLAAHLSRDLWPVVDEYEALKSRAGQLDFFDLLVKTRDLLRDAPGVRAELQARFTHLFIDEFQDTDPLQVEILMLLAADDPAQDDPRECRPIPGKLFLVGDPKQSIYRFRRADVALYERVKRRLVGDGAEVIYLTKSFRAVPDIQSAVNAAFAPCMRGGESGHQAEYVALDPHRPAPEGRPSVVALSIPEPYSDWSSTKGAVAASTADAVGAYVEWLVERSGWTVEEDGAQVPLAARHVCLLFKRVQGFGDDLTRPYVRALEARRVPHVLVGGRSFHEREEVVAMHTAVAAIEWPDDELSVYATLRGPFFSFADEQLLAFRASRGRFHPLRRFEADELAEDEREVADALRVLARLHAGRNRRPVAETLTRLLSATRAHAGIAIWPTGEQALANLNRLTDHARRFDARGATSFRGFVEWLEAQRDRGASGDAPIVEEGTDGVRLMTVHRAKGLEFPVVVLCDPGVPRRSRSPSRWVDPGRGVWALPLAGCTPAELIDHADEILAADDAEHVRVTYVAATRARDLLVVPAVADEEPVDGWVDVLHPALYPPPGVREPVEGPDDWSLPAFGVDTVVRRPDKHAERALTTLRPGVHRPATGDHRVVWWDATTLSLGRTTDGGLRQREILEADDGTVATEGVAAHAAWVERLTRVREEGARPTRATRPVTQAAAELDLAAGDDTAVERTPAAAPGRPGGPRFGTLVHAVLEHVPFDADEAAVEVAAAAHGRLVQATEDEVAAARQAVVAALAHPVLRRAAQSPDARREAPIVLRLDDGSLVDGVVDLVFREGDTWVVVDFKTDLHEAEAPAKYAVQVELYCRAVRAATGQPAVGILMGV